VREISHMLKATYAKESRKAAQEKAATVVEDLRRQKLGRRPSWWRRRSTRNRDTTASLTAIV